MSRKPQGEQRQIALWIPGDLHRRAALVSERRRESMAELVRRAIREQLARDDEADGGRAARTPKSGGAAPMT